MATKNIVPNADSEGGIGTSSKYWATGFIDAITTTGNLVIGGSIDLEGAIDVNGTTNLDIVDIDGAVNIATTALVTGVLTTTATQVANGGITSGSNIVSDTDSTDDLGTTSVRWANLFVDGITATDQITATGFTGTLDGILGSGTPAAATVTTLNTSGVVNLNLTTDSSSSTSGALIVDGGVGIAAKLFVGTDLDVDGTTNLDIVDIDGAVNMATTALVTGVLTTTAATVFNGGFASNDGSTITVNDNTANLTLTCTDADATVGPMLFFSRNSASAATNDQIGTIFFTGRDAANSEDITYATIETHINQATDGQEGGKMTFKIASHDAESVAGLTLTDGDAEDEVDVTIASGTSSVTTIAGNLGIGTSPGQKVVVGGGTNGRVRIKVDEAENNFGKFDFSTSDSATSSATMIAEITANITSDASSALTSELIFSTNSGDSLNTGLTISSGGLLTVKDDLIIKTGGTIGGASDPDLLTLSSNELEITGADNVNTRMILTSPGVSNTVLGFNRSGGTVNGVVNNASYLGNLQAYPLVFITNGGVALTLDTSQNATVAGALTVGTGNSSFGGDLFVAGDLTINSQSTASSVTDIDKIIFKKAHTSGAGSGFYNLGEIRSTTNGGFSGGMDFYFNKNAGSGSYTVTKGLSLSDVGDVTINAGNIVIGTAGKGIDFSATANGGVSTPSELLDDYEEGTWTPAFTGVNTSGTARGFYTKIGDTVHAHATITSVSVSDGNQVIISLPFTRISYAGGAHNGGGSVGYTTLTVDELAVAPSNNAASVVLYKDTPSAAVTRTDMSGKRIDFSITYQTAT